MNSFESQQSMSGVANVVGSLRSKGISLWSDNGTLRYRAPKGSLTKAEIEILKESRGQIIALLAGITDPKSAEPGVQLRIRRNTAPLSFSQVAHWNLYGLDAKPAIRQIAAATRLGGPLQVDVLEKSFRESVRRHDALRTRIVVVDGSPVQQIDEVGDFELEVVDLTDLREKHRETEVRQLIDDLILEPVDLAVGPLLAAKLLKLGNREHVLIVAIEHMVSDARSIGILLRDVFTGYAQLMNGCEFDFPRMPIQFADYCAFMRNEPVSKTEARGLSWIDRLRDCRRVRFPEEEALSTGEQSGWMTVPLLIGPELKSELREWCGVRSTTLVIGVFAAYVALVMRWCNVSEIVVPFVTDGRPSHEVENAIGYFASVVYPRIKMSGEDDFDDIVRRVTQEYCAAFECADHSFIDAQSPPPGFTRNSCFNWVPQHPGNDFLDFANPQHTIALAPVPFVNPMIKDLQRDTEPFILFFDTDGRIEGEVYSPRDRFSKQTIERFGRNFLRFLMVLLREPAQRVVDIPLI